MASVKFLDLEGLKALYGVVDSKINNAVSGATATIEGKLANKADVSALEAYQPKGDYLIEEDLEGYATESGVTETLKSYALKSEIPTDFYTKAEVDSAIEDAKEAIVGEDLKDALDTLGTISSWKEEHGTEYTNLLAEVQKKANASEVYTKGETDEKIAEVVAGSVDLTPYAKTAEVAETYATKAQLEGYQVKGDYALKSEIPTDYLTDADIEDFITEEALAPYAKTADFVALTPEEVRQAAEA